MSDEYPAPDLVVGVLRHLTEAQKDVNRLPGWIHHEPERRLLVYEQLGVAEAYLKIALEAMCAYHHLAKKANRLQAKEAAQ